MLAQPLENLVVFFAAAILQVKYAGAALSVLCERLSRSN